MQLQENSVKHFQELTDTRSRLMSTEEVAEQRRVLFFSVSFDVSISLMIVLGSFGAV